MLPFRCNKTDLYVFIINIFMRSTVIFISSLAPFLVTFLNQDKSSFNLNAADRLLRLLPQTATAENSIPKFNTGTLFLTFISSHKMCYCLYCIDCSLVYVIMDGLVQKKLVQCTLSILLIAIRRTIDILQSAWWCLYSRTPCHVLYNSTRVFLKYLNRHLLISFYTFLRVLK